MPDYGFVVGQSRTFTTMLGDKGRSRYSSYNPTAPIPMQLTYTWDGDTLAKFRQAWESADGIAWGGRWIRITLPVQLVRGGRGVEEYDAHMTAEFTTSLLGLNYWKITTTMDVDASPQLEFAS
jgi:hypothetical protein